MNPKIVAGILWMAVGTGFVWGQDQEKAAEITGWIQDLGSDNFATREAASKALGLAGGEARVAVRAALKSEDAEVRRRAQALWEELRWLVVPGADEDVKALVAKCGPELSPEADAWKAFAKKHGAAVLYLLTQLRLSGDEKNYRGGLRAALPQCSAKDLGKLIAGATEGREREVLSESLFKAEMDHLDADSALRVAQVSNLLWRYPEAFDFSFRAWMKFRKSALIRQAAASMKRGEFQDRIWEEALQTVPGMSAANERANALSFYLALGRMTDSKAAVPLVEKIFLPDKSAERLDSAALFELFDQLKESGLDQKARILAERQEGVESLYLRIYCGDESEKKQAWARLLEGLRELKPAEAEAKAFAVAEKMDDWKDGRRIELLKWILDHEPHDSVYDLNALFRMITLSGKAGRVAREGLYLEQAVAMLPKVGGFLIGASKEELIARKERLQKRTAWYFAP